MFSRACEYAIKIMIYIAGNEQQGRRTGLKEVTEAIASPEAFTAKILQQLVKAGLLESYRGPSGGFLIPKRKEILLYDVVLAIDGEHVLTACVIGLPECGGENPCPVHNRFIKVREDLKAALKATDIRDKDLLKQNTRLKI